MKKGILPELSVIVPAYKAERVIQKTLENIILQLERGKMSYEVICVADGRMDKTYEFAKKIAKIYPGRVRVVGYLQNAGKGHAVRYGMAKARGNIVGFIDAGFDINPSGLNMLLLHMEWYGADVIVGSKRHPVSRVVYPWQRRVFSYCYQILVKILFGLKIKDTQVGMKFFRREVLEKTLPRLLVKAWAFDIEILVVANYLGYKKIYEAPVELKTEFGGGSVLTSKGFLRTVFKMLWDTVAVFYRLRILDYYNYKNRKKWITPEYMKTAYSHKRR